MRYILNSGVITAPGRYEYRLLDVAGAKAWLSAAPFVSTIGYAETAEALSAITGTSIPVDRRTIKMEAGDEALVFRLIIPPGERRTNPADKGALGLDYILAHCELGILARVDS